MGKDSTTATDPVPPAQTSIKGAKTMTEANKKYRFETLQLHVG